MKSSEPQRKRKLFWRIPDRPIEHILLENRTKEELDLAAKAYDYQAKKLTYYSLWIGAIFAVVTFIIPRGQIVWQDYQIRKQCLNESPEHRTYRCIAILERR